MKARSPAPLPSGLGPVFLAFLLLAASGVAAAAEEAPDGPFASPPSLAIEAGGWTAEATIPGLSLRWRGPAFLGPLGLDASLRMDSLTSWSLTLSPMAAFTVATAPDFLLTGRLGGGAELAFGFGGEALSVSVLPLSGLALAATWKRWSLEAGLEAGWWSDAVELRPRLAVAASVPGFSVLVGCSSSLPLRYDGARSQADLDLWIGVAWYGR